jgi:hypothetical protein
LTTIDNFTIYLVVQMQMRYNRSPSSGMDPSLGGGYGAGNHAAPAAALSRSKGITTMTTMTISNLSDTVSKNDIAVSFTYNHVQIMHIHISVSSLWG